MLTAYVAFVAARIEYLNIKSGYYLPRNSEYRNNDPAEGLVTWCVPAWAWQNQTEEQIANTKMFHFVSSFGLLQYIVTPLLFLFAGYQIHSSVTRFGTRLGIFSLSVSL